MFFGKKRKIPLGIKVDLHSHLLPGVDDGVSTLEESLEVLRRMESAGYRKVCLTPHIKEPYFPNSRESLLPVFDRLQQAKKAAGINVGLSLAAEYYLGMDFAEKLDAGEELLTLKESLLLVEASMSQESLYLYELIFRICSHGYTPVIAHPERYRYYSGSLEPYEKLKKAGCLFQLNLFSLAGGYGKSAQKCARMLLDAGMINFIGSDIHAVVQSDMLFDRKLSRMLGRYSFNNDMLL